MTMWFLLGGPQHGELGDGDVPDGYVYEGRGNTYGPSYPFEMKDAEAVYRWQQDSRDIADGTRLLDALRSGEIQLSEIDDARGLMYQSLEQFVYALKDMPETGWAANAREVVAIARSRGLV